LPIYGSKEDEGILPMIFCSKLERINTRFINSAIEELGGEDERGEEGGERKD